MIEQWDQLRLVDLVDIVLVATLVAGVLVWVRRLRVGRVAVGLLAVVVLYLVARSAGLSLLSGLFEGSLAVFILIAVVIFQKELRRLFETISWPGFQRTIRAPSPQGLDLLVETVFDFASRGIGALVVIPGKELVEPHVSGGIDLQGKLSRPLLQSLFDPHSPGHDGAAILDGDRIARFGVHLPLSSNDGELSEGGTRHAAALGLSEHCDAMCVAVSEERHLVSVAHGGALTVVRGVPELRALLGKVRSENVEASQSPPGLTALVRRYWIEAAVSFVVVASLWIVLVAGSLPTEKTFELPVSLSDIPPGLSVERVEPERIAVTFRGSSSEIASVRAGDVEVRVEVALAVVGQRSFSVDDEDVDRPPGLDVIRIEPRRIHLVVDEK